MKPKRPMQQCVALLKDNSRCGKYAKEGDTLCAVHQPGFVPKGAAVARPKVMTHQERLEMFARSNDERVAMQAIGLLERMGAREQEGAAPKEDGRAFVTALTPGERAELVALITRFKALKQQVWSRRPDLRPFWVSAPQDEEENTSAAVIERQEPTRPAAEVSVTPEPIAEDSADDLIEVIGTDGPRLVRRGDFTVI